MNATGLDPEDIGKLFVGGLSSETTKESLEKHFSHFGEIVDSVVMKNPETGKSRGFGFITFKDPLCVYKALQVNYHELDGKKIDPKQCTPRSMQKVRKQAGKCKIFLGGLPPDITEGAIQSAMSKYGKVDQVVIMADQETKKCRGFGFLSFELEESIDQACAERFVIINGKQIECKRAEPRVNQKRLAQSFSFPKGQNGYVTPSSYGQISTAPQNNWNIPVNQPLYNFQGNTFPNFQSYGNSGMAQFNTSTPSYSPMQTMPYVQHYSAHYGASVGSYYSATSANIYNQAALASNVQTSDFSGSNAVFTTENEKTHGSSDYSQNPSSQGASKVAYSGGKAANATFPNQNIVSASNYQRYHPYKV